MKVGAPYMSKHSRSSQLKPGQSYKMSDNIINIHDITAYVESFTLINSFNVTKEIKKSKHVTIATNRSYGQNLVAINVFFKICCL